MTCNLYMMSITFLEVEIQNLRSIQIEMFNLEANIFLSLIKIRLQAFLFHIFAYTLQAFFIFYYFYFSFLCLYFTNFFHF